MVGVEYAPMPVFAESMAKLVIGEVDECGIKRRKRVENQAKEENKIEENGKQSQKRPQRRDANSLK